MKLISFEKYHGIGNDFILVDVRKDPTMSSNIISQVRELCDRRFGVGADGVLIVHSHNEVDARLEIYNADGSRPEMCGNGIRCVASFLRLGQIGSSGKSSVSILTDAGLKRCEVFPGQSQGQAEVTVDMGRANFELKSLPCNGQLAGDGYLHIQNFKMLPVSMGNPHGVIFTENDPDFLARDFGATLEKDLVFPFKCNIEFAKQLGPRHFKVGVWERGCGITFACGTGACAVAAAAVRVGLVSSAGEIQVDLPGGSLFITVSKLDQPIIMRGPSTHLFSGKIVSVPILFR